MCPTSDGHKWFTCCQCPYTNLGCGVLVLLKFYWAPDIMEFVLGRFSHFNIAIAYSNSTFCGAWTPSFCEFTQIFSKTSTPLSEISLSLSEALRIHEGSRKLAKIREVLTRNKQHFYLKSTKYWWKHKPVDCLFWNDLLFIGVCIMIRVTADYYWARMTSGLFMSIGSHWISQ